MKLLIFLPFKPIVLVWTLLSGTILIGFVTSSLTQGKDQSALRGAPRKQAPLRTAVRGGQHSDRTPKTLHP